MAQTQATTDALERLWIFAHENRNPVAPNITLSHSEAKAVWSRIIEDTRKMFEAEEEREDLRAELATARLALERLGEQAIACARR